MCMRWGVNWSPNHFCTILCRALSLSEHNTVDQSQDSIFLNSHTIGTLRFQSCLCLTFNTFRFSTWEIAAKIKAIDQARQKMEELTKEGIVAFSFILTDDGPELMGEEDVASKLMVVFEQQKIIELAQRINSRGQVLSHRNTRTMKIFDLQDLFNTQLPPLVLPLDELNDYDVVRTTFNKMLKAEGMNTLWRPGQNPPASIQEWCSRGWIVRLPRGLRGPSGRDSARQLHLNRLKEGKCWTSLWWRGSWGGHRWQQAWNECTRKTGRPNELCFARFSGHCCSQ